VTLIETVLLAGRTLQWVRPGRGGFAWLCLPCRPGGV